MTVTLYSVNKKTTKLVTIRLANLEQQSSGLFMLNRSFNTKTEF
jgi:hypothetical protein